MRNIVEIQARLFDIRFKVQIGLHHCKEHLCNGCPYKEFDKQCTHKLIEDINILYEENMIGI